MDPHRRRHRRPGPDHMRVSLKSSPHAIGTVIQQRAQTNNPHSTVTFDLGVMDDWAPSVALSKVSFASNYFYDVGMGLPKMSMLAFYWGIFPANRPTLRKAVYAVTGYVFLVYFIVLWMDTFFCGVPVSVQWSQEEGACSVFYAPEPFYFNFAMNQSSYVFGEWMGSDWLTWMECC
jgi:hypothetical protein